MSPETLFEKEQLPVLDTNCVMLLQCTAARFAHLREPLLSLSLQITTASGLSGLNGQVVHSSVMGVREIELVSVCHRRVPKTLST